MASLRAKKRRTIGKPMLMAAATAGLAGIWPAVSRGQAVTFLNNWSVSSVGANPLWGVAVGPTGTVYATYIDSTSALSTIKAFNSTGVLQNTFGGASGSGNSSFSSPDGVAVDASGTIYVADTANDRIQVLNSAGVYQSTIGTTGSAGASNTQFNNPNGVSVGPTGIIYVADNDNQRIQIFNSAGVYQSTLGTTGSAGTSNSQFNEPRGVTVGPTGTIYVADTLNERIQIFNSSGVYQSTIGTTGNAGTSNAQFDSPTAVGVGATGMVYVADSNNNRIQVFNSAGVYQSTLSSTASGAISAPTGITVAPTGMIYVAEHVGGRIDRFFDVNSWVSGTNTFTDSSVGPTTVTVGSGQILGTTFSLTAAEGLVSTAFNISSGGTFTQSGGSLTSATASIYGTFNYQSGTYGVTSTTLWSGSSLTGSAFTLGAGKSILMNGGTVNLPGLNVAGTFTYAGGTMTVPSITASGILNLNVALTNTGGTILASGAGAVVNANSSITGGILNTSGGGLIASHAGIFNTLTNSGTVTFDGSGLTVNGTINNTGIIESDASANPAYLYYGNSQTTTLSGGGQILLTKTGAVLVNNGSGGFINQDNTIHGFGDIQAPMTNNGTITADSSGNTLYLDGSAKTGTGNYTASNGGILSIGATITGGTFNTSTGGIIEGSGGTLVGITNSGTLTMTSAPIYLQGTISNSGIIQSDGSGNPSYLYYTNGQTTTLSGGGSILLSKNNAYIVNNGPGGFINQNNLIHGYGDIQAPMTNNSTISADANGNVLLLDGSPKDGTGTYNANNGGILSIGCTITGGTFTTTAGGIIQGNGGTLVNITNAGTLTMTGSPLYLQGAINNTGVVTFDATPGTAYLYYPNGQTATFSGGGSILLNKNNAYMLNNGPGGIINQDNLIHGFGDIQAPLTNNGTVSADSSGNTLVLDSATKSNAGTIKAVSGGTLAISCTLTNTGGSILSTGTGSMVSIASGGIVSGGTLNDSTGGMITGDGGTLDSVTNSGTLTFRSSGLYLLGSINNTGIIQSDGTASTAYLIYPNSHTATLSGGGSVLLTKNNAILLNNGPGGIINQDNLIHGFGDIQAPLTNHGIVSADSSGNTLLIDGTPKTNTATMKAEAGGILAINVSVTNTGGTILSTGAGSIASIGSGGTISGGTLNSASGGFVAGDGGAIDSVTNSGTVLFRNGLILNGIINNTGVIQSDSSASTSYLYYVNSQTATLSGGGSVLLSKNNAILLNNGPGGITNQDNLIHGYGDLAGPLINNGTIAADSSGNSLIIDGTNKTGTGNYNASNGGILQVNTMITGGTFNTSTGGIIEGSGGTLNNVTNAGALTMTGTQLSLMGTINNTGIIQFDSSASTAYLYYTNSQVTTLAGGGSVLLAKDNALIVNNGAGGFLNQDNLIHGYGEISAPLTNNATVSADASGHTLVLDGTSKNGYGAYGAVGGGTLQIAIAVSGGKLNLTNGGTLAISGGGAFTIDDTGDPLGVHPAINIQGAGNAITVPIALANGVAINLAGGSSLSLASTLTGSGAISVNGAGTLSISPTGAFNNTSAVSINTGAKVVLASTPTPSTPLVQTFSSLAFDGNAGSLLDVGNGEMIITASPLATIAGFIKTGKIYSSQTDAHHGVGAITSGGGTKARFTFFGDTDLNGSVNFADLVALAQHYNSTTSSWSTGDFNYDSLTNFADLVALAQNYNGALTPGEDAELSPSFVSDWNLAQSEVAAAVPEPASVGLMLMAGMGLMRRGRKQTKLV